MRTQSSKNVALFLVLSVVNAAALLAQSGTTSALTGTVCDRTGAVVTNATAKAKRAAADELRSALAIPDPARTAGRRVLVYDDVCTTASQLNAVADCLLAEGGAARVEALVLARAPWRRRT